MKKSKLIITGEDVVINSEKKVCNLFKTKPERSIGWIDEDGYELTDPDDIDDLLKRNRMREKEKFLAGKEGDESKIKS
ncbi:MAG: hypothetical protein ACKVHA_09090 [Fidelibacterota bacterium]|jgi:hypothetical protein|tara:strand:- start:404 stop:637 length:234 start_codon:yes stop_codon:yes gene_type:complete